VGDVVIFYEPARDLNVVHRVISVTPQGIRTRGDNNDQVDAICLQPADIMGKVTAVIRKNKTVRVPNGWPGHLIGTLLRTKTVWRIRLFRRLHPVYFGLARSGLFHIPSRWLGLRVLKFQRPSGPEMYLRLWNRWTIGVYAPERRQWLLRRPFRLFLDEAALPSPLTINAKGANDAKGANV